MTDEGRPAYRFGPFRLDVAEHQLLRDDRVLPLTPKVFDVLRVLVQNSGHLVTKEKLLAEVWPDSFVDEGALSRSISVLRKTLDEGGSKDEYIETVPKRGYRFIAPVTVCVSDGGEVLAAPGDRTATQSRRVLRWVAGIAALLLVIAVFLSAAFGRRNREMPSTTQLVATHRQVTFTGTESAPTISPDGRRIAYVSSEQPEKKLIVQELAGGPPLTIFTAPEIGYVRWSPDGTELILWARGSGKNGVYVLPQLGGTPRRIAGPFMGAWSPDGSTIAVVGIDGKMRFVDKLGREQRAISLQDAKWSVWDLDWSRKDVLTFVSSDYQGRYTLWTVKPDGSEQRRVIVADSEIPTARWAPQGDAIYYLRRLNQTFSLFKIPFASGADTQSTTPIAVMTGIESDRFFALSGDGNRLVYARAPYYSNLWLVTANGDHSKPAETRELTRGTSLNERPSISPDGTTIVFNVGYESQTNLHTMPLAGGPSKQLTFLDSLSLDAVWSADGKQIAFASTKGGQPRVWMVESGGGVPQPVSSTNMSDTFDLTWSPGSRVLYQKAGNRNYYQLDAFTRYERPLVDDDSRGWMFSPAYSPDGRKIAVMWNRPPDRGIFVIDSTDRRGGFVYQSSSPLTRPVGWAADARSIYVLEGKNLNFRGVTAPNGETMTGARIVQVPLNGAAVKPVVAIPFEEIGGISMTPDGRRFVCAVYSSRSDVWVVDNFDSPGSADN